MVETLLENAREQVAEISEHFDEAKGVVNDACHDFTDTNSGVRKSKRTLETGRGAAEDFVNDAEHTVKHYPKSAVASGIMTGIILGFCLGWMLARRD